MQISFFSHGDFSDGRVVRLSPYAEWRLLLNPNPSKSRKKENLCLIHVYVHIHTHTHNIYRSSGDACESK